MAAAARQRLPLGMGGRFPGEKGSELCAGHAPDDHCQNSAHFRSVYAPTAKYILI